MRFHDLAVVGVIHVCRIGVWASGRKEGEGEQGCWSITRAYIYLSTKRNQPAILPLRFPEASALNISSSATGFTLGMGTDHFPAFSARFCFTVLDSTCRVSVGV